MKKVLIIGYVWVAPNASAAGSRMLQLIMLFLENGYEVVFASPAVKGENALDLTALGVVEKTIELNASSFDGFIQERSPAVVVFDRFLMEEQFGWRVAEHCPNALRILDTEDLHALRRTRHEALKKSVDFTVAAMKTSDLAKREIAAILRCDLSLIISTYEMDLLQTDFQIAPELLYHLPFLLPKIQVKTAENWPSFSAREHFVFIGNFLHAPNVDAVLFLKNTLWKLIKKQLPDAELHIYGAYATQQINQLHNAKEGFLIQGYTTCPETVVKQAKVVLAPLRFGAGIKGKLTEAMCCGTPSVTTSIGAEGMHAALPWPGAVTTSDTDFVAKSVALYTQEPLWQQAQKAGRTIINTLYDKTALIPPFLEEVTALQKKLAAHRTANFIGSLLQHHTLQSTKYLSKWIEAKNKM